MPPSLIIGVTGLNCAGKSAFLNALQKVGFRIYSLSDVIREDLTRQGAEPTRENLIRHGNTMRAREGADILARRALKRMEDEQATLAAVDSIRTLAEVQRFRRHRGFVLVAVTAPEGVRYERARKRGRGETYETLEGFLETEQLEFSTDPNAQQLDRVIREAQLTVSNRSTIEDLEEQARILVERLEAPGGA